MNNKQSRQHSRSKKALSNALLVYYILLEGGIIEFCKSRKSNYALKVLRGKSVLLNEKKTEMDDFIKISSVFAMQIRFIAEDSRMKNKNLAIVNFEMIENYNQHFQPIDVPKQQNKKENNSRNKEAAFSNYLSFLLLQKGYTLHFSTNKMKPSFKVLQFIVWNGITTPDGNYYSVDEHQHLLDLINDINEKLKSSKVAFIDKNILKIHSNTSPSNTVLSVFTPVLNYENFSISNESPPYTHPFDSNNKQ